MSATTKRDASRTGICKGKKRTPNSELRTPNSEVRDENTGLGIGHQHGHRECLLCGDKNPWSLGLAFEPDGEGGVRTTFQPHERLQGYGGMLHGGVAAALLDAAMTHCLFHRGVRAVTADLRVRYPHPVPMGVRVGLRAWVTETCEPLYRLKAELTDRDHRVLVWAQATFCEVSADGTAIVCS